MSAPTNQQSFRPSTPVTREMLTVEPARINISVRLTDNLVAYGLGACVCVCLYDIKRKVGGMTNITLPLSNSFRNIEPSVLNQPARFVDVALPVLIDAMKKAGCTTENMRAAVVGGAHMAKAAKSVAGMPEVLQTGHRTVLAAIETLTTYKIPILGKDVGGSRGRTVVFRICDGCVIVKQSAAGAIVVAKLNSVIESLAA